MKFHIIIFNSKGREIGACLDIVKLKLWKMKMDIISIEWKIMFSDNLDSIIYIDHRFFLFFPIKSFPKVIFCVWSYLRSNQLFSFVSLIFFFSLLFSFLLYRSTRYSWIFVYDGTFVSLVLGKKGNGTFSLSRRSRGMHPARKKLSCFVAIKFALPSRSFHPSPRNTAFCFERVCASFS